MDRKEKLALYKELTGFNIRPNISNQDLDQLIAMLQDGQAIEHTITKVDCEENQDLKLGDVVLIEPTKPEDIIDENTGKVENEDIDEEEEIDEEEKKEEEKLKSKKKGTCFKVNCLHRGKLYQAGDEVPSFVLKDKDQVKLLKKGKFI